MPDFITLSCPSCGHKLQITEDIDRLACAACGNEHIVNRSGGIITLKPILESITKVQVGVDKTASELAIVRLNKEMEKLQSDLFWVHNSKGIIDWGKVIPGFVLVFAGLVFGGLFILVITEIHAIGIGLVAGFMFVILVSLGIYILWSAKSAYATNNKKIEADEQIIINAIEAKKRNIAEHQAIVSKQK